MGHLINKQKFSSTFVRLKDGERKRERERIEESGGSSN